MSTLINSTTVESIAQSNGFISLTRPLTAILVLLAAYYIDKTFIRPDKDVPPGPMPLPFLGHLLQVPTEKSWVYFSDLCQKYGPIVRLNIVGKNMIILNKAEDVEELLVRRSNNYSSRNQLVYAGKYRSINKRLVLLPYGTELKKQRAALFQVLNPSVVGTYEGVQEWGAMRLLADILRHPENAYQNTKWFTSETLFTLVYGKGFESDGKDLRSVLHILETFIQDMHPLGHAVDTFRFLDWLPDFLSPWRSEAKQKHEYDFRFYSKLFKEAKGRFEKGEIANCLSMNLLEGVDKHKLDSVSMTYTAGSAFEAGTDNTAGSILWFLVAAQHYPEVIRKAHEEIDRVLGADGHSAPQFVHFEQLPYVAALVRETFRWMPVAPVSAPHDSINDDVYRGYRIPAGTTVIPNTWAIHHDENLYPDPSEFRPERFLPERGEQLRPEWLNEGHYGFGYGRRICPGQYLASKSVWIGIVHLLWAFDISPAKDSDGQPILPDVNACRPGLTAEPATYQVILTPRSETHAQTIRQATKV